MSYCSDTRRKNSTTFDFPGQMFILQLFNVPTEEALCIVVPEQIHVMNEVLVWGEALRRARPQGTEVGDLHAYEALIGLGDHVENLFARASRLVERYHPHAVLRLVDHLREDEEGQVDVDVFVGRRLHYHDVSYAKKWDVKKQHTQFK